MSAPNYWPGIDTSREAGEHNPDARARMKWRVLRALIEAGPTGLTDHELHDVVAPASPDGGPRNRRVDLVRLGLVEESPGVRRPSRTGTTSMKVWRVVVRADDDAPCVHHLCARVGGQWVCTDCFAVVDDADDIDA